jgi:hypothetical protein
MAVLSTYLTHASSVLVSLHQKRRRSRETAIYCYIRSSDGGAWQCVVVVRLSSITTATWSREIIGWPFARTIGRLLADALERVTSCSHSQLVTMETINADLRRERERCSFNPVELTSFWDGNAEKTLHRRELGSSVHTD